MASGKLVYYDANGTGTEVAFTQNYSYDRDQGRLDVDDIGRAPDGTLHSYAGARKTSYKLAFAYAPQSQFEACQLAWDSGRAIDLYLDASLAKTITGLIMKPPRGSAKAAFISGAWTVSFDLEIEEI